MFRVVGAPAPAPLADDDRGLRCPACGCKAFEVLETRRWWGARIRRRRECRHCGRKLVTFEAVL